jgi:hypothetical protein
MSNPKSQFQTLLIKVKVFLTQLQMRISSLGKGSDKNSQSIPTPVDSVSPKSPQIDPTLPISPLKKQVPLNKQVPLKQKIEAELLEAWSFIQDPLVPTLLAFVTRVVEKIDPPLSLVVTLVITKFNSVPTFSKAWQNLQTNLQASSIWKKTSIAVAPVGRSLSEFLKPIATSASQFWRSR